MTLEECIKTIRKLFVEAGIQTENAIIDGDHEKYLIQHTYEAAYYNVLEMLRKINEADRKAENDNPVDRR